MVNATTCGGPRGSPVRLRSRNRVWGIPVPTHYHALLSFGGSLDRVPEPRIIRGAHDDWRARAGWSLAGVSLGGRSSTASLAYASGALGTLRPTLLFRGHGPPTSSSTTLRRPCSTGARPGVVRLASCPCTLAGRPGPGELWTCRHRPASGVSRPVSAHAVSSTTSSGLGASARIYRPAQRMATSRLQAKP